MDTTTESLEIHGGTVGRRQGSLSQYLFTEPSISVAMTDYDFGTATKTTESGSRVSLQRIEPPIILPVTPYRPATDSTPLQIWEGTVTGVEIEANLMQVNLIAKIGEVAPHTMEISLQWVSEQDKDLVQPGAVFYLTLFKRIRRGSVQNSQELRFRRRPAWSSKQLEQIQEETANLISKLGKPRTLE